MSGGGGDGKNVIVIVKMRMFTRLKGYYIIATVVIGTFPPPSLMLAAILFIVLQLALSLSATTANIA